MHIVECQEFKNTIDSMLGKANMASFLKSSSWAEQFKEAFEVSAGDDDDEGTYYTFFPFVFNSKYFFSPYSNISWHNLKLSEIERPLQTRMLYIRILNVFSVRG